MDVGIRPWGNFGHRVGRGEMPMMLELEDRWNDPPCLFVMQLVSLRRIDVQY